MKKNTTIWFLGSNASGKTTQSNLLHKSLGDGDKVIKKGTILYDDIEREWSYTKFGNSISNLGKVSDNQCSGTDAMTSIHGIKHAYNLAIKETSIVVVDGLMATAQWIKWMTPNVLTVLLDFDSHADNLMRLAARRVNKQLKKDGISIDEINDSDYFELVNKHYYDMDDRIIDNTLRKLKAFRNMYDTVSVNSQGFVKINADLPADEIHDEVLFNLNVLLDKYIN